jgi:REP element-mobilizing transposase RayT
MRPKCQDSVIVACMTRLRRVVAVNVPHHLTQRGNARQYILNRDEDRAVYLKLLRGNIENYEISLLGYCLMSNHVHLIAVPTLPDGLALAFRNAHGRYAAYWNAIHGASGHAWQGRFYSCPLDDAHLDSVALHGTEPCQGWTRLPTGIVALVQRRSALWENRRELVAGRQPVAKSVDGPGLARIFIGTRSRIRCSRHPSVHTYRSSAGGRRVCLGA